MECGASLAGPPCNVLFIDKIKLKEISNSEKQEKLKELNEREEIKNVIDSLKYTYITQELFNYSTFGGHHYFEGNTILEKKNI